MIEIEEIKQAILLAQKGSVKEAEKIFIDLYKKDSENKILLSSIGLFYVGLQNYENATYYLEKAYNIKKTLGTVSAFGFCEYERGNYLKASHILDEALLYGSSVEVYDKLISCLLEINAYSKAVEYSEKMLQIYPDDMKAVAKVVKSLINIGKLAEAEKICIETLKKHNDESVLWNNLGFLKELIYSDDKQACECFKIAAELGNIQGYYNMAVSYEKLEDYESAEKIYKQLIKFRPDNITYKVSYGTLCLKQKQFQKGYELFFERKNHFVPSGYENVWKIGDNLKDEVAIICDQGFGDHIQFIRYIPFLKEKVKKIYIASRDPLIDLFKKNYPYLEFISYEDIENLNAQIVLVSDLAFVLGMDFDNIPFSEGYLESDKAEIVSDKLKVGLCWEAGSAGIRTMINRTMNPKLLASFFDLQNIQFYSFQVTDTLDGNEMYPQMINLAKDFKTFEDTAKSLMAMDIVVTVDTSVAHLAGALGVKTYLILPYISDWRWFSDTKTTPWYKSIEIFKQKDSISWEEPINNIIKALAVS